MTCGFHSAPAAAELSAGIFVLGPAGLASGGSAEVPWLVVLLPEPDSQSKLFTGGGDRTSCLMPPWLLNVLQHTRRLHHPDRATLGRPVPLKLSVRPVHWAQDLGLREKVNIESFLST